MPSAAASSADTIRVLVATDNHVGYMERDPIRGNDSWQSFHEIMCLAKEQDVDMVLLSGDLFHENKPSRKSMYQVMRSLRMNCYGEKPCELEIVSDVSTNLGGAFAHANYEDPDINVAIPVFSIHGNHDDPSGEGRLCALDILQCAGLLNYYGRTPENDNITVSPILLQKGTTKLALYGLSNVRDERLFRTFRDGKVTFMRPGSQQKEWFNLICVHQNHHDHTGTDYLPENFLQEFLDLVIWGHEHECLIQPKVNPEMNFSVMQPGSSVATSLAVGEAVPKHVAVVSITGKDFEVEPIRLKSVRPFVMKEIVLSEIKDLRKLAKKSENRTEVTRYLTDIVDVMITEAKAEWMQMRLENDEPAEEQDAPLPLIRLRVEHSAPADGGNFEIENPQRFSSRFVGKVANTNDVVQFHRKKASATRRNPAESAAEANANALLESFGRAENVKVEALIQEYLGAQSLTILPQSGLGDAIAQFIDKGDIHSVEEFVEESLATQFKKVLQYNTGDGDEAIESAMAEAKDSLEKQFQAEGQKRKEKKAAAKAAKNARLRPDGWDSDMDGTFNNSDVDMDDTAAPNFLGLRHESDEDDEPSAPARGKATTKKAPARAVGKKATTTKKAPAKVPAKGRGNKRAVSSEEEEEEMLDDDEDDDLVIIPSDGDSDIEMLDKDEVMPKKTTTRGGRTAKVPAAKAPAKTKAPVKAPAKKAPAKKAAPKKQAKLNFSQPSQATQRSTRNVPSDDDIEDDDDDDDFATLTTTTQSRRR